MLAVPVVDSNATDEAVDCTPSDADSDDTEVVEVAVSVDVNIDDSVETAVQKQKILLS